MDHPIFASQSNEMPNKTFYATIFYPLRQILSALHNWVMFSDWFRIMHAEH